MNIFLHQLDMKINYFMQTEESIGYVRYADDMIFAIKSGVDSEGGLGSSFALKDRWDFFRTDPPRKTLLLGLVVSIGSTGILETRAPQTLEEEVNCRTHNGQEKIKNLSAFLLMLFSLIKIRVAFAFSCSYQYSEQEIISYFQNLIRARVNEFIKAHGQNFNKKGKSLFIWQNFLI